MRSPGPTSRGTRRAGSPSVRAVAASTSSTPRTLLVGQDPDSEGLAPGDQVHVRVSADQVLLIGATQSSTFDPPGRPIPVAGRAVVSPLLSYSRGSAPSSVRPFD